MLDGLSMALLSRHCEREARGNLLQILISFRSETAKRMALLSQFFICQGNMLVHDFVGTMIRDRGASFESSFPFTTYNFQGVI